MGLQQRVIVSLRARDSILGRKRELKKKRTLNHKHVRAIVPQTLTCIPDGCLDTLREAAALGATRAESIWRRQEQIHEREFHAERSHFQKIADHNKGYEHFLMTVFLSCLFLRFEKESRSEDYISGSYERTNRDLVAATAQREFTQACLCLQEYELTKIPAWSNRLGINPQWWKSHFAGALTVARLVHLFLDEGALVRFSRADEDIKWKIDLIVSFPSHTFRSEGLCVQVKSDMHVPLMHYRTFDGIDLETAPDKVRQLVNGVRSFQKKFRGIWIPVEITLRSKLYPKAAVAPQGEIVDRFRDLLKTVFDEHQLFKTGT